MDPDPLVVRVATRFAAHRQTLIKVNAPVDEGVAEVVSTLSLFPVITLDSCQGNDINHKAEISFRHADSDMASEIGATEARHRAADFFVWLTEQIGHWFPFNRSDRPRLLAECYGRERLQFTFTWDNTKSPEIAKMLREIASGL